MIRPRNKSVRWFVGSLSGFLLLAVGVPIEAKAAKVAIRKEKAFGACVDLPTRFYPKKGIAEEQVSVDGMLRVLNVVGADARVVTLTAHRSYKKLLATEKPGWVSEGFRVDKVTTVVNGYVVIGHWEGGETEAAEKGGPWQRYTFKTKGGSATTVDFFFTPGDYKANKKSFDAAIASARTC
jgi:hypothetical protein